METTFQQAYQSNHDASTDAPHPLRTFDSLGLFEWLGAATATDLDLWPIGVVGMALDGTVEAYNAMESKLAGLQPDRVIGRNFFTNVAPCTNNFMVAHRFQSEPDLDCIIEYVLTLRMRPQKVSMRLMRSKVATKMFLAIQRRA